MPTVKGEFANYLRRALAKYNCESAILSYEFEKERKMTETNELPNPAKLLKKVLAEAHFDNTDIGGAVFSLLDSLSYDYTSNGWEHSDATEDLMQEVVNILAKDYDDIRTDEEEDEEIVEPLIDIEVEPDEDIPEEIITALKEVEESEEIDEVPELPDLSDLEEIPNGAGNKESVTSG